MKKMAKPKRHHRLSGKDRKGQNDDMVTLERKPSKQKRRMAENFLLDVISNASPETKQSLKELKKYPFIVKAVYLGQEKAIDLLLETGDSVNVQIADGTTLLMMAIERGHIHLVDKLIEAGADPTALKKDGTNALMISVIKSDIISFNILWRSLEKFGGYNPNHEDKHGNTLLVYAANKGWDSGVTFLLSQNDININHQTLTGQTALMAASVQGHLHIVEKLINRGSDLLTEDKKGATALCYAVFHGHHEIARCFYQQMDYSFKNTFVKRRIELLSDSFCSFSEMSTFYKEILFSVLLDIRRNMEFGVDILCENHIFTNLIACAERNLKDIDLLWILFHLAACLIYDKADFSKYIDVQLAENYMEANFPELILKVLNIYKDEDNFQLRSAALLSIQAVTEIESGKSWLRSNFRILVPHIVEFSSHWCILNYWQEGEHVKVSVMWERFKDISQKICHKNNDFKTAIMIAKPQKILKSKNLSSQNIKQKRKRKQFNNREAPIKIAEKRGVTSNHEMIFDPITKYNFGPCNQTQDSDGEEFELVVHSKKGKCPTPKIKPNQESTQKKDKKNLVNVKPVNQFCQEHRVIRNQYFDWSPNRENKHYWKESNERKFSGITFKSSSFEHPGDWNGSRKDYAKALRKNLDKTLNLELEEDSKNFPSLPSSWDYDKFDVHSQKEDSKCGDGFSPGLSIDDSKLTNKLDSSHFDEFDRNVSWTGTDQESYIELSESLYSDSESRYHSDIDDPTFNLTGDKNDPDGGSDTSSDNGINMNSNLQKITINNSNFHKQTLHFKDAKSDKYVNLLLEVLTNMMRMLMRKCERSLDANSPNTKEDNEIISEWQPLSERWRSLLFKLVAEPKKNRSFVKSAFYVEQNEYALNQGKFSVYIGLYKDKQEVIIKKMYSNIDYRKILQKAISLTTDVISHRNILSLLDVYYDYSNSSVYLIMDLCEYNLQEYLSLLQQKNLLPYVGKELIHQLLEGLKYLHGQQILHGRLKPTNIQLNMKGILLLSDFGLLDIWPPSCGILSDLSSDQLFAYSWRPRECVTAVTTSMARAAFTSASDIQVAGMLIHFILTGGHPFGSNDIDCQVNIARANTTFQDMGQEADDIITWMLCYEPTLRPTASMVLNHPYFWYSQKRLDFLTAVASQPEMEPKSSNEIKRLIENTCIEAKNWVFKVHPQILQDTYIGRPLEKTTSDLLRLILNCVARYSMLSRDVQMILNSPALYFTDRFPSLVMSIYKVLRQSHWKYRPSLVSFF